MSTQNLCFGAKIRKIGITLQTPVLLHVYKSRPGLRDYTFHGHAFLMLTMALSRLVGKPTNCGPNRSDTNRPVQTQKRGRSLKFRI